MLTLFWQQTEATAVFRSGAAGSRTLVQTYPLKAFYMFITALIVGKKKEQHKPITSVDEWS
jgi:hypothetical protein